MFAFLEQVTVDKWHSCLMVDARVLFQVRSLNVMGKFKLPQWSLNSALTIFSAYIP